MSVGISGTEGYAEEAPVLAGRWQSISFADHHAPVLHLIPATPCRLLDVGSGVGADAAAFAALGHTVLAVEPVDELRSAGIQRYPSPRIEWLDDSLPDMAAVLARGERFDVVMLTAVWMHLDEGQRRRALPRLDALLREGGVLIMSLRHGPIPKGRRMFDVSAEETIALARIAGLRPVLHVHGPSTQKVNRDMDVTWTRLAFGKSMAHDRE